MGVLLSEKEKEAMGMQEAQGAVEAGTGAVMSEAAVRRKARFSFRQCCCGCSLQTGSIVIGTFGLMNGLTSILIALYGFGHLNFTHSAHVEASVGEYGTSSSDFFAGDENILSSAIMMFYGILHVITAFCLIYGADKRRPSLIKFWLFTRYVEFVMSIIGSVFIVSTMAIQHAPPTAVFTSALSFFICIVILAYCIATVRGFHLEVLLQALPPLKQII